MGIEAARCWICTGRAKQKVASELFPTQIAPQNKFPDLQRLFTLLVIGRPAMKKFLETSSATPWRSILFESTGVKNRSKNLNVISYYWPTRAVECSRWASSCSRRGEQPGSCSAQHGSGAMLFPCGWFTRARGGGSRQFVTGISSNAVCLARNQKSNPGHWKQFRSMIFLLRRQQLLLAVSLRAQQERGRKALFLSIVCVAYTKPLLS